MRDPLDLEERLASLMSDSIQPRLVPDLEILPWRRTHILAVQVHPSPSRPDFLKREGLEGGVYVRVGSFGGTDNTHIMYQAQIRQH